MSMGQPKHISTSKPFWGRLILLALALVIIAVASWLLLPAEISKGKFRNIVLISIDTCRADYLSCYGFARETTPNIDAIAAESVVFENVISPVPLTLPAHCSMLTGTLPPSHGVHDNLDYRLRDSNITLAEILKQKGFVTGAIISAFVLDSQFGIDQGFDSFNDHFEIPHMAGPISERKGQEASRFAIKWLEQHKNQKFFLFLHYFDPHTDYVPPEPFASKFADELYAGEIAYTDYCIGQVIQKLKQLQLLDSTLLIITSDHGEMLGEHGEKEHSYFIYQSAIKVPLIFRLPTQGKSKRISQIVSLVDIVPTVCSLISIEPPSGLQGQALSKYFGWQSQVSKERYIYAESLFPTKYNANSLFGVLTNRWKYIQTTRPELYDLTKDPQESNNLIKQQPKRARLLQKRLKQILEQAVQSRQSTGKFGLDEESRERLESLGYVSGMVSEDFEFDQSKDDPKDLIDFHLADSKVNILISQKKYAEARILCEELSSRFGNSYRIYRYLGKIAFVEGDKQKSKAYMLESLRLNPKQTDVHNNLSIILEEEGKRNEAIEHLVESLQINPEQIVVHNNLAVLLERQGKSEQVIAHLTESLRIKYNQADIHIRLADILYRLGKVQEAIKHWSESLCFNPLMTHTIHNRLGSAFYRLGKPARVIEHWNKSLELEPNQPNIKNKIGAASARTIKN